MKFSKATLGAILAIGSIGFINAALANHFTVGGSENGSFTISGAVYFGITTGESLKTVTFFPDNQVDVDNPSDIGLPITTGYTTGGGISQYLCNVSMQGSVVNGVASVTSISILSGGFCSSLIPKNLPWRFHTLSSGAYQSYLEGVGYYRPGAYNCVGVPVGIGTASGSMGLYSVNSPGCFLWTANALRVTPALEIVNN